MYATQDLAHHAVIVPMASIYLIALYIAESLVLKSALYKGAESATMVLLNIASHVREVTDLQMMDIAVSETMEEIEILA